MPQASKGDMSSRVPREKAVFCRAAEITDLESGFVDGLKHGRWDRGLWFDWVFARVLLREASELLHTKLDPAQ